MDELDDIAARLDPFTRRFCEEYAGNCNGNGVKACRAAGHPGDYGVLATTAYRLLRKVEVLEYLAALQENDERIAGRIERLQFLTSVVRGELKTKARRWDDGANDGRGGFVEDEIEPALKDRLAAQEALSKLAGEQVAKHALTNAAGEDLDMAKQPTAALLVWAKQEGE